MEQLARVLSTTLQKGDRRRLSACRIGLPWCAISESSVGSGSPKNQRMKRMIQALGVVLEDISIAVTAHAGSKPVRDLIPDIRSPAGCRKGRRWGTQELTDRHHEDVSDVPSNCMPELATEAAG